jgi:hypothetical protein
LWDRKTGKSKLSYFRNNACSTPSSVLEEQGLPLSDRLAIALRFLPDEDLLRFVHRLAKDSIASGDLDGLVCTGLTSDGIALLQTCEHMLLSRSPNLTQTSEDLDKTSDVQTTALISTYFLPPIKDRRLLRWIASYRSLLDQWTLYTARAKFDVARSAKTRSFIQAQKAAGKDTTVATAELQQTLGARLFVRCNCKPTSPL